MSKTAARLALLCAMVGLGASVAAAYVHYRLLYDPSYTSVCDISATFSCTQVYMSRFSTLAGIPVAVFGTIAFVFVVLLLVAALLGSAPVRESVPGYLFIFSTLALAVVLYLGYASFVLLKTVCVFCLLTYAAVIGLFLVSGASSSIPMTTLPRRAARDLRLLFSSPLALTLAVLFLAGAGTTLAFFPRESPTTPGTAAQAPTANQQSEFERWYTSQPRVPIVIPNEGAKVLVVKFNDFQCPPCKQSFLMYRSIFAKYEAEQPGTVKLVLRDYPLSSTCNANVTPPGPHAAACEAAVAVRLARQRGKGNEMEEWVFANQATLTPPLVRQGARDVGGITDFDAKFTSTLELVKGDIALGQQLGVLSTPTFFINGVKIQGALPPQYFEQALAYELKRATGR